MIRGMDRSTVDALKATADDPRRRIVFRGATVLTQDPALGDLPSGDVLVVGDRIEAVGPDLGPAARDGGALLVDVSGAIVLPGLQDTHRHCWQSQLRRLLTGVDLGEYVEIMHGRVAPACAPGDIHVGTYLGALGAIDSGVTTMLDFSHNNRSVGHTDAALDALRSSGIRAVLAYGAPLVGEWDGQWPGDLPRLVAAAAGDALVDVSLAVLADEAIAGAAVALTPAVLDIARRAGVPVIADAAIGPGTSANVVALGAAGLLGPDVTLIHATKLDAQAWTVIADTGVAVALCPTSDPQVGLADGVPPIQQVLDRAVTAGISVDVECCLSTSLFAQMHATLTVQRMEAFRRRDAGDPDAPEPMSARQVLDLATVGGAAVNGVRDRVGSLSPGMLADLVVLDAERVNTMPMTNAVATVVVGADTANVDTVLVGGRPRKVAGELVGVDLDRLRVLVEGSRDHLLAAAGFTLDVVA